MFNYDERPKQILLIIGHLFILILAVFHLVSYFYIKKTDFNNIFDTFESSPLFNFRIDTNCGSYDHIIFHVWEGRNEYYFNGKNIEAQIVDKTDITKINGYMFCYKKKTYKELLYNGQIIKKDEECGNKYPINCGIIDTLEQKLCIKNDENCPLYDIGIGVKNDDINYEYNNNANVYYNKDNYKGEKKIIGKLILNDGQPCYNLYEKLWKKFSWREAAENHLKCDLKIFGKLNDDRYESQGDITYRQIYKDNLSKTSKDLLVENIKNEKVSLYKRVFLGIDKECDEQTDISKDQYKKLIDNQDSEQILVLFEVIILFSIFIGPLIDLIYECKSSIRWEIPYSFMHFSLIVSTGFILVFIICHSVFIGKIIHNDLSYDCSDDITNEVLRQENTNTKKSILWIAINLGGNVFFLVYNVLIVLIYYLKEKFKYCGFNVQKSRPSKQVDIKEKDGIKPNYNLNKPVKEVVVENNLTTSVINNDKNSKINSKENNNDINSQNQKLDCDVTPPAGTS